MSLVVQLMIYRFFFMYDDALEMLYINRRGVSEGSMRAWYILSSGLPNFSQQK